MKRARRIRISAAVASAAAVALAVTSCSGGGTASDEPASTENPVTLKVTTFGTMGLDGLYEQYENDNPGITIEATNIDTGGNALTDWKTKQAAGSGLPDVQAVEEGWLGQVMTVSDTFVDLRDHGASEIQDRWVPWKTAQATDPEGRIIGYGTDIGPQGICYNGDLLEDAGLPSDREEVAELLGGDSASWKDFFDTGKKYEQETGKAWYDQSGFVWNAMVNQLPEGYYTADGSLNIEGNTELRERWDLLADAAQSGLSAAQTQWDWGKGQAFVDGSFATFVCPGWMLGVLKGQVEAAGGDADSGWDFADVFPGGPANWGGTFLTVPEQSTHPAEAAKLAEWLTNATSQAAAFEAAGTFPSNIEAQSDPVVTGQNDLTAFFNDAPIGEILGNRAEGVEAQFKGADDSVIQEQVFGPATIALDKGTDGQSAWDSALETLKNLDLK
ncbi:extracellular solute-binding protein [Glutamicibacter sp. MNS18]|uniref:ABC transporter substrate-binding protein n=1 Tax=Glutamicibacter sp. MNS18 TaxID=2989817 RepID=UPI0022361A9E|nr:extracellular solute-binding protein [Glutamicibacter sp. MNS18]MCW4466879.1 extracellular solute-binding protein [Glutamicibacter sp. MNS18]